MPAALSTAAAAADAPARAPSVAPARAARLVSLDVFRGATIVGMILVNNPGSWGHIFGPLKHAAWHGWTPTDLVFPFFLFIVGVSLVLAFSGALAKGTPRATLMRKAAVRAAWLFAFGLLMALWPFFTFDDGAVALRDLSTLRIMGVLQRIALCYLAAAALFLYARREHVWALLWAILVGYTLALLFAPVPGLGRPEIDTAQHTLGAWLDRAVLTPGHLWGGATPPRTWDPEGLLSTLPALSTTLFGVWTGLVLASARPAERKALDLLVAGVVLLALGYAWALALPLNKALWTSSYAVFTAGQALLALGALFYWVDVRGRTRFTRPFVVYGVNAITVFVMSGIVSKLLSAWKVAGANGESVSLQKALYEAVFVPLGPPKVASLLYALVWITCWYGVLRWMYGRKMFIKV